MYVAVTRTQDPLDQPIEVATIAGDEMMPWLRQIEGFQGLLVLTNETGASLVLAFWESREVAERHHAARMQFRDRVTAAVNVEVLETVGFEVAFADIGPLRID